LNPASRRPLDVFALSGLKSSRHDIEARNLGRAIPGFGRIHPDDSKTIVGQHGDFLSDVIASGAVRGSEGDDAQRVPFSAMKPM